MTTADLQALRLPYPERALERLTAWCARCGTRCSGPHPKPADG